LLDAARLPRSCLGDPDMMIPVAAAGRLLESAAKAAGAEDFGLRLAETRNLSNLVLVGLIVREQPTIRKAIEALIRSIALHNQCLSLGPEETGDLVILSTVIIVGRSVPVRQSVELAIGVLYRILRLFLGNPGDHRRSASDTAHPKAARSVGGCSGSTNSRYWSGCPQFTECAKNRKLPVPPASHAPSWSAKPFGERHGKRVAEADLGDEGAVRQQCRGVDLARADDRDVTGDQNLTEGTNRARACAANCRCPAPTLCGHSARHLKSRFLATPGLSGMQIMHFWTPPQWLRRQKMVERRATVES
jgi:hypothetical protein